MKWNPRRWLRSDDTTWVLSRVPPLFQIWLVTFGILALELAIIRWTASQVSILAYFNNLVLIGAFLGMGLGVAIGRRHPGIQHWTLPVLCLVTAVFSFSGPLGLMDLRFPDASIHLWGNFPVSGMLTFLKNILIVALLFVAICVVFLFAGGALGHLLGQAPILKAYGADLAGSLCGILAIVGATAASTSPPWWFVIGGLPFLFLSRRPLAVAGFVGVIVFTAMSVDGALFSPYNRIDIVQDEGGLRISVNRHFHQYMHDLSSDNLSNKRISVSSRVKLEKVRRVYDLPFSVNQFRDSALIVGAGTGNDAQAALRRGYRRVVSVDIDGEIVRLGKELHPEQPYADRRTVAVVNDARAFFKRYTGPPFDVVCFGLLDSHAMFSALSSLRLDNYVYTEEGIREAWALVSERGHLSLSFSTYAGAWIADRLYWTIYKATGLKPVVFATGMHSSSTYIIHKPAARMQREGAAGFRVLHPRGTLDNVTTTSDNWPFLYIRPGVIPWGYIAVLFVVLLVTVLSIRRGFRLSVGKTRFDLALFFLGAGFLLLETRGLTTFSLLFGSTWIVNAAIFSGVLVVVFLANLYVHYRRPIRAVPWFLGLFVCLLVLSSVNPSLLNHFPLALRGVLGGLLNAMPIGVAGVIFSLLLARASDPAAALGSNLLGAVVGGVLEYLSMVVGLQNLVYIAIALYLAALLVYLRAARSDVALQR